MAVRKTNVSKQSTGTALNQLMKMVAGTANVRDRSDFADLLFPFPDNGGASGGTGGGAGETETEEDGADLDVGVQLLINAIPIAHEGNIITAEYHNALRKAILAIAARLGMDTLPESAAEILNFAPRFLPSLAVAPVTGGVAPDSRWAIQLNKAVVPAVAAPQVSGWLPLELPDGASIQSIIVRGKRNNTDSADDNPEFAVSLKRMRLDTDTVTELVKFDLGGESNGKFKKEKKLQDFDTDPDSDEITRRLQLLDWSEVKNLTHQYFVTADWEGNNQSARFEIHSIQIFCRL